MNENAWLTADNPGKMLAYLRRDEPDALPISVLNRKMRLFACAVWGDAWLKLPNSSRRAIETAKRYADSLAEPAELWKERETLTGACLPNALEAAVYACQRSEVYSISKARQAALIRDVFGNPWQPMARCPHCLHGTVPTDRNDDTCEACKGTCVYLPHSWRTPLVLRLAEQAYQDDWQAMLVLADALEEAGCEDEAILRHCRGQELCPDCLGTLHRHVSMASQSLQQCVTCLSERTVWPAGWIPLRGPHVRGCHVLDAILRKA